MRNDNEKLATEWLSTHRPINGFLSDPINVDSLTALLDRVAGATKREIVKIGGKIDRPYRHICADVIGCERCQKHLDDFCNKRDAEWERVVRLIDDEILERMRKKP